MLLILWFTAMAIHLGFVGFLVIQFGRGRPPVIDREYPKLSVVVAAHNEYHHLVELLPLLQYQDYPKFEIIIALDRCDDSSLELQNEFPAIKFLMIDEVPQGWNPKKNALFKAIEQSTGHWLVFTDADCRPHSGQWLRSIMNQSTDSSEIMIGFSPYKRGSGFLSNYIHFESFMTAFQYMGMGLSGRPYMAVGRNMAIRRAFFLKKGGYESFKSVMGGDDDLFIQKFATKQNTKIFMGSNTLVSTFPKKKWQAYWAQKVRHLAVGHQYKNASKAWLSINHFSHLVVYLLLPWVYHGQHLLPYFLIFLIIKGVGYRFAGNHLKDHINLFWFPFVDVTYALLTPIIAIWSKFQKDIQWMKN